MDIQHDSRPIGIFDSGVGGLTVLKELARFFPHEHFIYLGDTARVPYGAKSARTIERYTIQVANFLIKRNVKGLVAACNTASALGLGALRAHCDTPVLGVIQPGCQKAVDQMNLDSAVRSTNLAQPIDSPGKTGEDLITNKVTATSPISPDKSIDYAMHALPNAESRLNNPLGQIGIIGTRSTVASGAYPHTLALLAPQIKVRSLACPLFVPLVDEGWEDHAATRLIVEDNLAPFIENPVDVLILGCTHYPVLKSVIAQILGPQTKLIDSAEAVAESLGKLMGRVLLPASPDSEQKVDFHVTDVADRFQAVAGRFLDGLAVDVVEMVDL
jgi:glutamate racemase